MKSCNSTKAKRKKVVKKKATSRRPTEPKLSKGAELMALNFLEKVWPEDLSDDVREAFECLKSSLKATAKGKPKKKTKAEPLAWPIKKPGVSRFDPLDLIKKILLARDMLFLSQQITYHISAGSELPKIWGDPDRLNQAFTQLIEHLVRRADRGSRVNIGIKDFTLRNGPGVEITFEISDHLSSDIDSQAFLDSLLHGKVDEFSGVSLYNCRQTILDQRGQMWADLPKPHSPIYHVALPASEEAAKIPPAEQQTFKYDISIINYANVRKRFGIKKSASLVTQIEHYIRSLVRYPIDMVMAIGDKGVITTIYETQKGSAHSVASRISQRLGKEEFCIGKKPVELMFRYHLSQLAPQSAKDNTLDTKRSS